MTFFSNLYGTSRLLKKFRHFMELYNLYYGTEQWRRPRGSVDIKFHIPTHIHNWNKGALWSH